MKLQGIQVSDGCSLSSSSSSCSAAATDTSKLLQLDSLESETSSRTGSNCLIEKSKPSCDHASALAGRITRI